VCPFSSSRDLAVETFMRPLEQLPSNLRDSTSTIDDIFSGSERAPGSGDRQISMYTFIHGR